MQVTGLQLQDHECLRRYVVFAADTAIGRRLETETRVIIRVPEHDDGAESRAAARLEACVDQRGAHSLSLPRRRDRHRREAGNRE
jgi:hypothetical protein